MATTAAELDGFVQYARGRLLNGKCQRSLRELVREWNEEMRSSPQSGSGYESPLRAHRPGFVEEFYP